MRSRPKAFIISLGTEPRVYRVIHHACLRLRAEGTGNFPNVDIGEALTSSRTDVRSIIESR